MSAHFFFDQADEEGDASTFEPLPFADDDEQLSNEYDMICITANSKNNNSNDKIVAQEDEAWESVFDALEMGQSIYQDDCQIEALAHDNKLYVYKQEAENDDAFFPINTPSYPTETLSSIISVKRSVTTEAASTNLEPCQKKQRRANNVVTCSSSNNNRWRIGSQQSSKWDMRFQELVEFKRVHQHCCVPAKYEPHCLAKWVKRQRYQYRLLQTGKHTAMTRERQAALEELGFIWDLHDSIWEERLNNDLYTFKQIHGHCKVPLNYPQNPELAIWAKAQRRHFIRYCDAIAKGKKWTSSTMNQDRFLKLAKAGFVFFNRTGHEASDALQELLVAKSE